MAKDAKGHGSDSRGGGANYARQAPTKNGRARVYGTSMEDRIRIAQDRVNINEGRSAGSPGNPLGRGDNESDASYIGRRISGAAMPGSDREAASALSSGGPKSDPVPVHDSMVAFNVDPKTGPTPAQSAYAQRVMHGENAWGQSPKDAAATRKSLRQERAMRTYQRAQRGR